MFKNLRNIASEIKGDHARSTPDDSVSSESKTRRFLSSKSSSSGIHLRKKHKEWEEIDGKTEDETVVHLALHHAVSAPVARQYHNQEQSSERPQVNHSSSEGSRNETTSPGRFQSRFSSHTSLHNLHTSGSRFGRRKEQ
ncbi:hypothetical protein BOH78_3901 [Pichia kudriavzevii]|uniref:Uncharacterized protein n=1 Tax=Pichia kudriavzevii TaxID=4909 RepID=A0A1V2LIM7_PICKU|nr:hypothetical protein BOH78_3901 [Pichia kudriavzevii]